MSEGESAAPRLLVYTHALVGGGAERVSALLATGFAERGHDVVLAVDFEASENRHLLDARIRTVVLGRGHLGATVRLALLIARERPAASISALSASNLKHAVAALLAGRARRAVLTYHGFARSEPKRLSRLGYRWIAALSRLTARTVAVSGALRDDLVSGWGSAPGRTVAIHNPVRMETASPPSADDLAGRDPVVLAAGRLTGDKDFPMLVRAFAQGAQPEARLVILGEGPDRPAIEAEIARLGLSGRVSLPGYTNETAAHFARARAFVLSSRVEAFGLVLVEALAHGLPVVATDCGGPGEILEAGRYGQLVPPRDEAALAAGIARALAEPGDPEPRVERARAFSLDAALDAYGALVRDIDGGGAPGRGDDLAKSSAKTSAQRA